MTVADIQKIGSPEISKAAARNAFLAYKRGIVGEIDAQRKREYQALMRGYKAIVKGQQVIDLPQAMSAAGLQDTRERFPRLAVCRADAKACHVYMSSNGSAAFGADDRPGNIRGIKRVTSMPPSTFPAFNRDWNTQTHGRAVVPIIPANLRPRTDITNYHIVWDAVWTRDVPVDPLLVRHLAGGLYAIVAAWDLTPLERAVMRGRL